MPAGPKDQKRFADGIGKDVQVMRIATAGVEESTPPDVERTQPRSR